MSQTLGTFSVLAAGAPGAAMKINLRQEIAMWVLGLLWTGLGLTALIEEGTVGETVGTALGTFLPLLVLLVPIFLIIFSLRDRARRD